MDDGLMSTQRRQGLCRALLDDLSLTAHPPGDRLKILTACDAMLNDRLYGGEA